MKKNIFIILILLIINVYYGFSTQKIYDDYKNKRIKLINNKIHYMCGKDYPDVANAIFYNVDPKFDSIIISIIWKESRFNSKALSPKYNASIHRDYGLMQISSAYWKFDKDKILEPDYNIKFGYEIYQHFWDKSNSNLWYSLKYYNGSNEYARSVLNIYARLSKKFNEQLC